MPTRIVHVKLGEPLKVSGPAWVKFLQVTTGNRVRYEVTDLDPQRAKEAELTTQPAIE